MVSWVRTRLPSCPDDEPPVDETGDPALFESETEGECRASRELAPPTLPAAGDELARDEVRCGLLPAAIMARERAAAEKGVLV